MRVIVAIAALLASAANAFAQSGAGPNISAATGPDGTHFEHELPISSYSYKATIYAMASYRVTFNVWHNTTLKVSETCDVINPPPYSDYTRVVNFSGWNLAVGDTVRYFLQVTLIAGRYIGRTDTDNQYGDVVDRIASVPARKATLKPAGIDVIDERRRFEALFA